MPNNSGNDFVQRYILSYLFRSKLLELFLSDCRQIWCQLQADLVAATDKNYTQVFGELQIRLLLLEVTVVTSINLSFGVRLEPLVRPRFGWLPTGRNPQGRFYILGTQLMPIRQTSTI